MCTSALRPFYDDEMIDSDIQLRRSVHGGGGSIFGNHSSIYGLRRD
jgi:hypothetical protein